MQRSFLISVLILIFLAACSAAPAATLTETLPPEPTLPADPTLVQKPPAPTLPLLESPAPTEPLAPTETLPPTPSPALSPTPTETPLPVLSQAISEQNAAQVTELLSLGKGSVVKYELADDGNALLVLTPLGLYHLDPESLAQRLFHAGAQEYTVLPGSKQVLLRFPEGLLKVVNAADGSSLLQMNYQVALPWYVEDNIADLPAAEKARIREMFRQELFDLRSVATSLDGSLLAISTGDHHLRVWSLSDGALLQDLQHDLVTDADTLAFSPQNDKLLVVEASRDMAMWDLAQGKLLWHRREVGHINGQPFSPDGSLLAAEISSFISADSWVVLLSAQYGDELGKITGARVSSDPFSADGKLLATFWYQRVRLYLTSNLAYVQKFDTGLDIASVSYTPDGAHLLVNGGVQAWDSQEFTQVDATPFQPTPAPAYEDPTLRLRALGFYTGLDGVLALEDGALRAWGDLAQQEYYWFDLPAGEQHWMALPEAPANTPLFAADGSAVFYCNEARLFVLPAFGAGARDLGRCSSRAVLAYAPQTGILARGQGTTLDLIEATTGVIVHNLLGHYKQISGLAFSQDGSLLASGSKDIGSRGYGEVAMWTTEPAHNLVFDSLQPWGVYHLAYSPDDRWLAYYNNNNLRIWSVSERRLYAYFDSMALTFAFSPDSRLLATGDGLGQVALYTVPAGKELAVIQASVGEVAALTFSLDGTMLIVTGADGVIRLLGVP